MGEKWPKESGSNDRLTANAEYLEKDATQMPAMHHVSWRLTRGVQPRAHLRELELDRLERGDGGAEGLALLRVGHRNLEGCLPLRTTSHVVSGLRR